MLRFVDGIQVDARGNSAPGAPQLTSAQVQAALARDAQEQVLHDIAAGASKSMGADRAAGFGYGSADFASWCSGKGLTTTQRMEAKRLINDLGLPLEQVARRLRV